MSLPQSACTERSERSLESLGLSRFNSLPSCEVSDPPSTDVSLASLGETAGMASLPGIRSCALTHSQAPIRLALTTYGDLGWDWQERIYTSVLYSCGYETDRSRVMPGLDWLSGGL